MNIIEFLQENTGWIKDIVSLIFAATATVLAILTYRRAKATILQPMRNEVVKKQTEYLTSILELINDCKNDIDFGLDYSRMYGTNCDLLLNEYKFKKLTDDEFKEIGENFAGWIQFLEDDSIGEFVYLVGGIPDYKEQILSDERIEHYHNGAKKGTINVHRIFNTQKHQEFLDRLKEFANNPFLPEKIHRLLEEIVENIKWNTHIKLREILMTYIGDYSKGNFTKNKDSEDKLFTLIEYQQLMFREFKKEKKDHKGNFEKLKKEIRLYLRIDEKWI